ncbi:GyrI-like domain-containing protein [Gudongella sp. DL1XJH-153]|uniref:GyrI-like domain-containing protein n=1 Tax=Gudongella sp. DL1XJH-153 TaxID=3409804 RepID=UPI003BB5C00B
MPAYDFKKEYKSLYNPKKTPEIIEVPDMKFLMVEGSGDPNTSDSYKEAVEILYGLSYTIKMSKKNDTQPKGYFDFVVPPLEGLWWFDEDHFNGEVKSRKNEFNWIMMIRQPDFVTAEVFEMSKDALYRKKPRLNLSRARLGEHKEGLCAQIMHIGPYDDEPATVDKLEKHITAEGYKTVMGGLRQHHEIYLSDPRKSAPEKLKTIIRHPIAKM